MERIIYSFMKLLLIIWMIDKSMAEPIRGHNISPASVPFIASIGMKSYDFIVDRNHLCTGSLIAETLVLTTAHCVAETIPNKTNVVIGASDLKNATPKYDVIGWRKFKNWAAWKQPHFLRLQNNDLAIMKLRTPVVGVTPAKITTLRTTALYGKNATMIGWIPGPIGTGRYLHKAQVHILTPEECRQQYRKLINLPYRDEPGTFCTAASPYVLSTKGDSGAPLLDENNNILGVTQGTCPRKSKICNEEYVNQRKFNVHLDFLDEYRQFINEVMQES